MDIRRNRLKNKLSFDGWRQHFVPSSRPKSSSSSSQYTLVSHSSHSPTWAPVLARDCQSVEEDNETLYEIDPATGEYCEMSFSKINAAKHIKIFIGHRSSVSKDHRSDYQHQPPPQQQQQQHNHYLLESSPRSKHNEFSPAHTNGVYAEEAVGEPLIDDTNPDYIPNSARPLISKFIEEPMISHLPEQQSPTTPIRQPQPQTQHSPKTRQQTFDRPKTPTRSRSTSPTRPMSKHFQDHDPLSALDPSMQRMDSPQAKIE